MEKADIIWILPGERQGYKYDKHNFNTMKHVCNKSTNFIESLAANFDISEPYNRIEMIPEIGMRRYGVTRPPSLHMRQNCFLQKEARVCVSNAFVIEDSKFKLCFFFVVEDEQVREEADVIMWI